MELDIIKFLSNRNNYETYIKYIKPHTLTKECNAILRDMDVYYHTYPSDIDWGDFKTWFCVVQHPSWKEEKLEVFKLIFDKLSTHTVPSDASIVDHFIMVDYATKIFTESAKVAEGTKHTLEDIVTLIDEYKHRRPVEEDSILLDSKELIEEASGTTGLIWRLPELNKALGKLDRDLVMVGGRPDSGKTTLLASEVTHMAKQLPADKYVIWFNNEERGSKVKVRLIQAALNTKREDIFFNVEAALKLYQKEIGGENRVIIKDSASISVYDVRKLIDKYPPGLIIIDQLSKIVSTRQRDELETYRIQHLGEFARQLTKDYCPVIFTVWADGSAEGQKWIEMSQLYGSKTGLQGEADAIITIGRSNDEPTVSDRNNRYLYIPKNKMIGEEESLRNGKFELRIDPTRARFK